LGRLTGYGLSAAGLLIGVAAAGVGNHGGLHLVAAAHAQAQQRPAAQHEAHPPATQPTAPPAAAASANPEWSSFPTMLLEKIYRGPLRDTIIQRWRDPIDGSVCFVYMPISTPLLPPPAEGYVQYGPNQIGSISCIHPTQVLQLWQGGAPPPVSGPATKR
jgi:hypothetical protein